jgi:hypothetical protein
MKAARDLADDLRDHRIRRAFGWASLRIVVVDLAVEAARWLSRRPALSPQACSTRTTRTAHPAPRETADDLVQWMDA